MWSCLAFKMGQAPFHANSDIIGLLGLCGVAGALTASFVGKYVKRVGVRRFNFIAVGMKGGLPHLEGKAGPHGKKGTEV